MIELLFHNHIKDLKFSIKIDNGIWRNDNFSLKVNDCGYLLFNSSQNKAYIKIDESNSYKIVTFSNCINNNIVIFNIDNSLTKFFLSNNNYNYKLCIEKDKANIKYYGKKFIIKVNKLHKNSEKLPEVIYLKMMNKK